MESLLILKKRVNSGLPPLPPSKWRRQNLNNFDVGEQPALIGNHLPNYCSNQPNMQLMMLKERNGSSNSTMILPPTTQVSDHSLGKGKDIIAPVQELTEAITKGNQDSKGGKQDLAAKKQRRLLQSRQYSQNYRLKRQKQILALENAVRFYEEEIAIKFPVVQMSKTEHSFLQSENETLKKMLSAVSDDVMFKEAQNQELEKERDELLKLYDFAQRLQNQKSLAEEFQLVNMEAEFPEFMEAGNPLAVTKEMDSFIGTNQSAGASSFETGGQFEGMNMNEYVGSFEAGQFEGMNPSSSVLEIVGLKNTSRSDEVGTFVDLSLLFNRNFNCLE